MVDNDEEEPIVCTSCDTTPQLYYNPTSDQPFRLRCDCQFSSADVTACLNDSKLVEAFSGKWSNVDFNSSLRYEDRL